MVWDSIEAAAAQFDAGELSTEEYLSVVEHDPRRTLLSAASTVSRIAQEKSPTER